MLEQFRSFCQQHNPANLENAVEKFAIFGGVEWGNVDTSKPTFELIEKLILDDYTYIRNDIHEVTTGMPLFHSILSGIATGDSKTHTAFKRANVTKEVGDKALGELLEIGIIKRTKHKKQFTSWSEHEVVSDKLYFVSPFLRFWFAFVSPLFKGIKEGDYKEVKERFSNRKDEFVNLIFEQLCREFLKLELKEISKCSSYWDNKNDIEIYALTEDKKTIAGSCKYTNTKVKKNELTKLREKCEQSGIKADVYVLFAKSGFSNELKALKGENLKLYTLKSLKKLTE